MMLMIIEIMCNGTTYFRVEYYYHGDSNSKDGFFVPSIVLHSQRVCLHFNSCKICFDSLSQIISSLGKDVVENICTCL
jgi:hypothetical protein